MSGADRITEGNSERLSVALLKGTFGHFGTGVTVITGRHAGTPHGFTCQSFVALSMDPPYIAFCPAKSSESWPLIRLARAVSVNILSSHQADICARFAQRGIDRFEGTDWFLGANGSPALANTLARVEANIVDEIHAGDHTIVVAELTDVWTSTGLQPLLYYRSKLVSPHEFCDLPHSDEV
ncbi:flavin reductase [Mycolicibacterium sp. CH28]|uniref:flavin reductase family protein n=1 Tax=Mycolicibacterium sp. CH28 TaxID=2512237 RepID=UPI001081C73A|nr:flavin reductase family protein [Mycolicibacterium sp. CH28]TGD87906.1 flavin reductase [Mycolicibacterium sp. CH28]